MSANTISTALNFLHQRTKSNASVATNQTSSPTGKKSESSNRLNQGGVSTNSGAKSTYRSGSFSPTKAQHQPVAQQTFMFPIYNIYIEHCTDCDDHEHEMYGEHTYLMFLNQVMEVTDAIESAAENDLMKKEIQYDKLRFDENGEEIKHEKMQLGLPPEKYRFKVTTNKKLPEKYGVFEKIDVPSKNIKGQINQMVYDQRTGKLAYFPRRNSFEVVFESHLIYSRYDLHVQAPSNTELSWPSYDDLAQKIIDLLNSESPYQMLIDPKNLVKKSRRGASFISNNSPLITRRPKGIMFYKSLMNKQGSAIVSRESIIDEKNYITLNKNQSAQDCSNGLKELSANEAPQLDQQMVLSGINQQSQNFLQRPNTQQYGSNRRKVGYNLSQNKSIIHANGLSNSRSKNYSNPGDLTTLSSQQPMIINDYSDSQNSPQTYGRNQNPLSLRYHDKHQLQLNSNNSHQLTSNFLKHSSYLFVQRDYHYAQSILLAQSQHKNLYNSYIRQSQQQSQSHLNNYNNNKSQAHFDEMIRKKVQEFRTASTNKTYHHQNHHQVERQQQVKRGRSYSKYLGVKKKDDDDQMMMMSVAQLKRDKKELRDKIEKEEGKSLRKKKEDDRSRRYEIDKIYQVNVPLNKVVYKKIMITNTTKCKAQFGFKSSHPFEVQIVNQPQSIVELDPRHSTKLLLRFQPLNQEDKKQYVILITADGRKFLNILMSVNYMEAQLVQEEQQQPRFLADSKMTQKGFVL